MKKIVFSITCVFSILLFTFSAAAWTVPEGAFTPVALTPQETLALYGTNLQAVYFDGTTNHDITFTYFNTTSNLYNRYCELINVEPVAGVNLQFVSNRYGFMSTMNSSHGQLDPNRFVYNDFLVYRCQIDSMTSSLDTPWTFQVYLENSLAVSGISAFYSSVFWSNYAGIGNIADYVYPISNTGIYDNPWIPRSSLDLYINGSTDATTFTQLMNDNGSRGFVFGSCMQPYEYHYPSGVGDVYRTDYNYWFQGITFDHSVSDVTSGDTFTWDKTILYAQNMNSAMQYSEAWYDEFNSEDYYSFTDPYVYLLVMCPVLYGEFILPDNSGSGSGTGTDVSSGSGSSIDVNVTVNVDVDVDLTPVLSRQDDQIDQLNEIIVMLNEIYEEMVNQRLVNPDLTPVSSITTNTTVKSKIDQSMQDATFPQNSDFDTQTLSGLSALITSVRSLIPSPLLFVYSFGLIGGLVSFIIFRRK